MSRIGRCYYSICRTRVGHALVRRGIRAGRRVGLIPPFHITHDALELDHASAAGLMKLWTRIHWSSGDGMMPPEQLLAVYRLAATWPGEGDIVELGAWTGLTTSYLAAACDVRGASRVHAVDTFEGTKEGGSHYDSVARFGGNTFNAFQQQIRRAGVAHRVETLTGYSAEMADRYRGRPIRMLLIDADHSYNGVRDDFACWAPLVRPGGLIVFHDYCMPEVARFVDQAVRSDPDVVWAPGHVVSNLVAVTKRVGSPSTSGSRECGGEGTAPNREATAEMADVAR